MTAVSTVTTPASQGSSLFRPTISNAKFFEQYFASSSSPSPSTFIPLSQPTAGYSDSHPKYKEQQQHWASAAYKIPPPPRVKPGQVPLRAQAHPEVRVVFQATYQLGAHAKTEKTVSACY